MITQKDIIEIPCNCDKDECGFVTEGITLEKVEELREQLKKELVKIRVRWDKKQKQLGKKGITPAEEYARGTGNTLDACLIWIDRVFGVEGEK